jgi:two-component system sensor histidine kinase KdpD
MITWRRTAGGAVVAAAALAVTTVGLTHFRNHVNLLSAVLFYLLSTVLVALASGLLIAVLNAVAATLLINFFFTPPLHRFTISEHKNVLALGVFVFVAVVVALLVERAERRRREAARASVEAETLATVAGSVLRGESALNEFLGRLREALGMESASLLELTPAGWQAAAASGSDAPLHPEEADSVVVCDTSVTLALRGPPLDAGGRRVARAFAHQAASALRAERLEVEAEQARPLRELDKTRTALLSAVSHDLRTPLAGAKAAVSSLRSSSVEFSEADRDELLATADESLDRLTRLISNLLDMSRVQAGAMVVHSQDVDLDGVIAQTLDSLGAVGDAVLIDAPDDLPVVRTDPGLLERVLGNLLENAVRFSAGERPVELSVRACDGVVLIIVADHGPGLAESERERMFMPFQRLGDTSNTTGVGLGLAVARAFTEAIEGTLTPQPTPGGGLSMVVALPLGGAST